MKKMKFFGLVAIQMLCLQFLTLMLNAQIVLPKLISDGMVLQRETTVKIWGWAGINEKIRMDFMGNRYETVAGDSGSWTIMLHDLKPGGPYDMIFTGSKSDAPVTIHDILVGDVWVCSGQSNMETTMDRCSPLYRNEIANSKNDMIRYFAAPQTYDFNTPKTDYKYVKWQKPDPQTVLSFSAVGYFFAREIYELYHVPVGIINTAIGGTPTEAWISEEAIKQFPKYYDELQRFKSQALIDSIERTDREKVQRWYIELGKKDEGNMNHPAKWSTPDINDADWSAMDIPGYWANTTLGKVNGIVWFRKNIMVPASLTGKPVKLLMGRIVDADSVFVNGTFIGTVTYQYPPRRYTIPAGILHEGLNNITVKVISNGGIGGFVPDKPYYITDGQEKIDLTGSWHFRCGAVMSPSPMTTTIKYKPSGLFNAMISPLLNLSIKGVLWYQGESNTDRVAEQREMFPALVNDWRSHWKQGNFPFLYVQLPNFMEAVDHPSESNWAQFREVQMKSLSIPNTAMAVTIDLGEWNDIHPLNKLDVAKRLFIAARKLAYGDNNVVYSGPVYSSMKIKNNRVILSFNHIGKGLLAKGGKLKEFAIAGEDKKFVWAEAVIRKNKIIVSSPSVSAPVAVRYAWADNPSGANLYNQEGLPASPFRTDNW